MFEFHVHISLRAALAQHGMPSPASPLLKRSRHISPLLRYRTSPLAGNRGLPAPATQGGFSATSENLRVHALQQQRRRQQQVQMQAVQASETPEEVGGAMSEPSTEEWLSQLCVGEFARCTEII